MSGDIFGWCHQGVDPTGIQWVEAREVTKHRTMHRTLLAKATNYFAGNVNSAEVQKPRLHPLPHRVQSMNVVKLCVFLSLSYNRTCREEEQVCCNGAQRLESLALTRKPVTSRPRSPIAVTVITFFSIKTTFPSLHSCFVHKLLVLKCLTPWTQRRGRGPPRCIWNSFVFQKH